jgi:hypothetical protein
VLECKGVPKMDLSEIIKMNPQKIDLLKKYRSKINEKLCLYREAENISKSKSIYVDWQNATNNNPIKSPIYSKVLLY